jgi:hypothetical protein
MTKPSSEAQAILARFHQSPGNGGRPPKIGSSQWEGHVHIDDALSAIDYALDDIQAVKKDLTRLFEILATTESGNSAEYKPTQIVCSREVVRAELNAILSSLESWAKPPT